MILEHELLEKENAFALLDRTAPAALKPQCPLGLLERLQHPRIIDSNSTATSYLGTENSLNQIHEAQQGCSMNTD